MRIIGTDIYVAYEDSFNLTLNLPEDYNNNITMKFSFDLEGITQGVNDKTVTFSINSNYTTEKPGEYYYEVIGKNDEEEQTTLIKKSLFVIEETARYAAKMTTTFE